PVPHLALFVPEAADAADDLVVHDDGATDQGRVGPDLRVVRHEGVPVARREHGPLGGARVALVLEQDREVVEGRLAEHQVHTATLRPHADAVERAECTALVRCEPPPPTHLPSLSWQSSAAGVGASETVSMAQGRTTRERCRRCWG